MGPDESCVYEPTGSAPLIEAHRPVTYGSAATTEMEWTPEASACVSMIPSFVRGVVTKRVEDFARKKGYAVVDLEVMAEVRQNMPVDFSKRLPFFLQKSEGARENMESTDA